MKLEVGMYVRTETGQIGKITNFDCSMARVDTDKFITYKDFNSEITKASHNIIDLIQVGDYVNGMYIDEIKSLKNNTMICMVDSDYECTTTILNEDIESIVTKEQFEQMAYRV